MDEGKGKLVKKQAKAGFFGGLLRARSLATQRKSTRTSAPATSNGTHIDEGPKERRPPRRASDGDGAPRPRRRPKRTKPRPDEDDDDHGFPPPQVLTEWPPAGILEDEELTPEHALELVAQGAPTHRGGVRAVPHAPEHCFALYATTSSARDGMTDGASLREAMAQLMTLRLHVDKSDAPALPWDTLEQPSCASLYGHLPGTVTLGNWVSMGSLLPPAIELRDSGVLPRQMSLASIMARLKELQAGLEDDNESMLYRILYKNILRDPDRILSPHRSLDKQITDLILVLSRPTWVDFTEQRNQVVTRFIFDQDESNSEQYCLFLHQLLLSMELDLRISSRQHSDWAKEKLLRQIPPSILWSLALARRWREYVRIDAYGNTPAESRLRYKLKKRQVKMIRRFAQAMKWPNLEATLENLRQHDEEFALDNISSDAFAFFSGLVLPGPTFPFLIMNALIDLDPDPATDNLALLTHTSPNCGFQYRNSYTYWAATCIVGKVLAPTCCSLAGWVGPARPTSDLGRSQIARIRSRRPRGRLVTRDDAETMGERSDPLGPPAAVYPVDEYALITRDEDALPVDTVRVEFLGLRQVAVDVSGQAGSAPQPSTASTTLFDATIQFAIDGLSWPIRLTYDASFVAAWPCSRGPHPLFFDYVHRVVRADDVVRVRDWGGRYYGIGKAGSKSARSSPAPRFVFPDGHEDIELIVDEDDDEEKVLVVEAYGVADNEVLARAWCAHWGLSAVVADIKTTCMACAIREAYAATLTVVIMVDKRDGEDENQ